jgi:hypothetical protein
MPKYTPIFSDISQLVDLSGQDVHPIQLLDGHDVHSIQLLDRRLVRRGNKPVEQVQVA